MRATIPRLIFLGVLALLATQTFATGLPPGEYSTLPGYGLLDIKRETGFELNPVGANGHL